jgi:hypothetical protein
MVEPDAGAGGADYRAAPPGGGDESAEYVEPVSQAAVANSRASYQAAVSTSAPQTTTDQCLPPATVVPMAAAPRLAAHSAPPAHGSAPPVPSSEGKHLLNRGVNHHGTVRVFRQKSARKDAIGSHACSLEALADA